ncbi:NAD-dependent epimerase/dehydratase family protein [Persicitalea jodogahamensis]|uniref:Epimerase n=1 Tax=Persicitalea jodogahamensis TaxID=402147 RepID=A0A8J3D9I1_9BACT|nr:NAD-dependent epimerase/dehydratase family protein [Persicitalea jodogahamensis]GHB79640.1 epimerase [Persicitalea jodogahamensis]
MNVIVTGATGMVGEGVMHVCLNHPDVDKVLVVNRRPNGVKHPKLTEIIHQDFFDLSAIENHLKGYDACFFCLGVSSVGLKEPEYFRLTHSLTMHVAETMVRQNPEMVFSYVSGMGTDGTEKGRSMWARVKGKTENDLRKLPFRKAYAFRPGFIKPMEGMKHVNKYYKYINWLFPAGRKLFRNGFCTNEEIGLAMIYSARNVVQKDVVEGRDIIELARLESKTV